MDKKYNTYVLIGMQWGDEGKSKILNYYSKDADYIVKYQNTNYVTHSYKLGEDDILLNILPTSIISSNAKCILSASSMIDIEAFLDEVYKIEKNDIVLSNLYIDGRAHIVMPYHITVDNIFSKNKVVKSGFESCYKDKITRKGIRISDLLNLEHFSMRLAKNIQEKNDTIMKYTQEYFDFNHIYDRYKEFADKLRYRIIDGMLEINKAIDNDKKVIFESSQSLMNDVDFGAYPYINPTNSTVGSACIGSGVAPNKISNIIGVFKAYSTKVLNDGILPTRIEESQIEKHFIEKGNEYYNDYPKACGWLDLAVLKYGCIINGVTELAITKLDILTGLEKIKLAIAYEIDSIIYDITRYDFEIKENCEVLYKEFDGWNEDISKIKSYDKLPENCKRFLEYIEGYLGIKISVISVGTDDEQIIVR